MINGDYCGETNLFIADLSQFKHVNELASKSILQGLTNSGHVILESGFFRTETLF